VWVWRTVANNYRHVDECFMDLRIWVPDRGLVNPCNAAYSGVKTTCHRKESHASLPTIERERFNWHPFFRECAYLL
jgi:hypothetical protein